MKCICTTDNPADTLEYHKQLRAEEAENGFRVLPTFRPDGLMAVDAPGFAAYCKTPSKVSGVRVKVWEGLKAAAAALCGSFQGGELKNRMQFGNARWFNDAPSGMKKQLTMFAEQELLGNFTGMLTDSRSFLSYPRHEYFRRVLCRVLGRWVEEGKPPDDDAFLGAIAWRWADVGVT